ncbi:NAD(+) diphosphatase [Chitinimonas sp. PSY-7]|uniref:NAD(+) diphosphatase n=1 Tax=Chitinimonas sp. PSY-7 TaxID=3459088 RepID=UPI00403FF796
MVAFQPAVSPLLPASPVAWQFSFVSGKLLLPEPEQGMFGPQVLSELPLHAVQTHYLGRLDGVDCWTASLEIIPTGWRAVSLRTAMQEMSTELMSLAARAAQVIEWDRAHRYCGVCGTPTVLEPTERCRSCPACKHVAYPRLSPAMMALVWRGKELLLARSPGFAPGFYSALAGFVEAGESLEDCVHREVAEEVGVQVSKLRYYGSQSWPFPHSLMVAYTAEWQEGEIVPQAGEIEDAQWFSIDALPGIPPRFSIAGHLIRDTVAAMRAEEA